MAQPVSYAPPRRDPRAELQTRLENAPAEHAEALLGAYEVLQGLHDRGVLDLLRGALGSSDRVIEIAVEAAKSPESIRGIRNLTLLVKMLGAIEPERLKMLSQSIPPALKCLTDEQDVPSLWALVKGSLGNRAFRRGLAAAIAMLTSLGARLANNSQGG